VQALAEKMKDEIRNISSVNLDNNIEKVMKENSSLYRPTEVNSKQGIRRELAKDNLSPTEANINHLKKSSKPVPFTDTNNKMNLYSIINELTRRDPKFIPGAGMPLQDYAASLYIDYEKVARDK
jgi:hypothetical protein